ncbi:hypothetical protein ACFVYG_03730 [Streptomyces sp. NPDC058256]|uniref:hypothetical protein n=1 Tax=Streptomyces sp. NPDC058256 TaxID=3346408 RepID=UPI0036EF0E7B
MITQHLAAEGDPPSDDLAVRDIYAVTLKVHTAIKADQVAPSLVSEDPTIVAQTLPLLAQAQAVSVDTKVRILHPDWDDTAVQTGVDPILTQTDVALPDPMQSGALG